MALCYQGCFSNGSFGFLSLPSRIGQGLACCLLFGSFGGPAHAWIIVVFKALVQDFLYGDGVLWDNHCAGSSGCDRGQCNHGGSLYVCSLYRFVFCVRDYLGELQESFGPGQSVGVERGGRSCLGHHGFVGLSKGGRLER